jgi:hypothetical protein
MLEPGGGESPSIARAVARDRTLTLEDTAHPEKDASARKIASVCGARYVLFPKLMELTMDLSKAEARVQVGLRVVPDIGDPREVAGGGSAQLKPETTTKEEVAARKKRKLLWIIPMGTAKPRDTIGTSQPSAKTPAPAATAPATAKP